MYSDKLTQSIAKAATQVMDEQLKGDQHKIDKNKNGKVDAHDFKLLRSKNKVEESEQIDEISKATAKSYTIKKMDAFYANKNKSSDSIKKDLKGLGDAHARLTGAKPTSEEVELQEEHKEMKVHSSDGKHIGTITHGKYQSVAYAHPNSKFGGSKEPRDDEDSITLKGPQDNQKGINFIKAHHKSMTEEVEQIDEVKKESKKDFDERQKRLAAASNETAKDSKRLERLSKIPGYTAAMNLAKKTTKEEVVSEMDYGGGRSPHAGMGLPRDDDDDAGKKEIMVKPTTPKKVAKNALTILNKEMGKETKNVKEEYEELEEMFPGTPEYEKKYGKAPQDMKPGEKKKTTQGEMEKTGKGVVHRRKFSEMLEVYGEDGIKGLFEALQDKEKLIEEPTNAEFTAELEKAKNKAVGKDKSDVAAASVQAVKQTEETHTTVSVIDYNDVNGVKFSEIDLTERELTDAEMKEREKNVKGMKKGVEGFKERYGKDAKSVMYATATKMAKEK